VLCILYCFAFLGLPVILFGSPQPAAAAEAGAKPSPKLEDCSPAVSDLMVARKDAYGPLSALRPRRTTAE